MKNKAPLNCNRRSALLAITGAFASLAGCGGGGSDLAGLSSGGTGSFTSGTITGLGSIIVNGIRYTDDTATKINADDGSSGPVALQVGMVVTIEGSALKPAASAGALPTATATRITYGSEWKGPVSNIQMGASTFEILGLRVDVLSSTVFAGNALTLGSLQTTHFVEVHGYLDPVDGHIQASRIEVSTSQPTVYRLSGALTQLDRVARTATLGPIALTWGAALVLPTGLDNGSQVRVRLDPGSSGAAWTVTRFSVPESPAAGLSEDREYETEIHGRISAYSSNTRFSVNGLTVNAAGANIQGSLAMGVQVEVKGSLIAGELKATRVEAKSAEDIEDKDFEFIGQLTDVSAQSFVLRDQTFEYDANTQIRGITLAPGASARVEVKARRTTAGGWYALRVELED